MAVSGSALTRFARTMKQETLVLDLIRCRHTHQTLPWQRRTCSARARSMANLSPVSSKATPSPKPLVLKNVSTRPAGRPISIPQSDNAQRNKLKVMLDAMKSGERIVLYRSGNHGAFYAFAYGIGGALLVGTFLWAQMFMTEREGVPTPGYLMKCVMAFEVLSVTMVATVIILGPTNLIQKVSILSRSRLLQVGSRPFYWSSRLNEDCLS